MQLEIEDVAKEALRMHGDLFGAVTLIQPTDKWH